MSSKKTKNRTKTKSSFSVKSFFYKMTGQLKGKLSAEDIKKLIIMNLPYIFIFIIANRISHLYQISPGEKAGEKIMYLMEHSNQVLGVIPSFQGKDLLIGIGVAAVAKILIWQKQQDSKKFRKGVEYGSAKWGDREDIKPYMADNPWLNVPLTATESITMESRPKNPKYARNKNILVIGGSGSGKTRL